VTKMYCDDSDCRRGMKFGAGVGAHKTNNATKVNPEIQRGMGVKRGANAPKMGTSRMLAIVFVPDLPKFKQIWRSI